MLKTSRQLQASMPRAMASIVSRSAFDRLPSIDRLALFQE